MKEVFTQDITLVNINEYSDDEILQNPLLAILNGLLKHGKKSRKESYLGLDLFFPKLLNVLEQIDFSDKKTLEYLRTGLNFIFVVGNIKNLDEVIQHAQQLPAESKGEVMTIAEQLIQRGREESAEALRLAQAEKQQAQAEKHQIALNLLNSGLDIDFVSKNTHIDVETLNRLLEEDKNKH